MTIRDVCFGENTDDFFLAMSSAPTALPTATAPTAAITSHVPDGLSILREGFMSVFQI